VGSIEYTPQVPKRFHLEPGFVGGGYLTLCTGDNDEVRFECWSGRVLMPVADEPEGQGDEEEGAEEVPDRGKDPEPKDQ
jgi:hypothetical protein